MVFWYKADEHPPFKIGAPAFWEYHSNNFSGGGVTQEPDLAEVAKQKKKGPIISVKKNW